MIITHSVRCFRYHLSIKAVANYCRAPKCSPFSSVCNACAQKHGLPRACNSGLFACLALQAVLSAHVTFATRAWLRKSFSRPLRSRNIIRFQLVQTLGTRRYSRTHTVYGTHTTQLCIVEQNCTHTNCISTKLSCTRRYRTVVYSKLLVCTATNANR